MVSISTRPSGLGEATTRRQRGPVGRDGPAQARGQRLRFVLAVAGPDELGRVAERGIGRVDDRLAAGTQAACWATPALRSSWTSQYPIMPWVWATSTSSGYGRLRLGSACALQREHPHLRPVAVAEHELVTGGQRGEGRGGLPDVPPLDHGVRPLAPLEQGVAAEGHYDAHPAPLTAAAVAASPDRGDHERLDRVHPVLRLVEHHGGG